MTGHEMVDPANGELRRDDRASRPGIPPGGEDAGSTYVVVWAGRGPIPGIRSEGWRQVRNTLLEDAPGHTGRISNKESLALPVPEAGGWNNRPKGWTGGRPKGASVRCVCGRVVVKGATRCAVCVQAKRRRRPARRRAA